MHLQKCLTFGVHIIAACFSFLQKGLFFTGEQPVDQQRRDDDDADNDEDHQHSFSHMAQHIHKIAGFKGERGFGVSRRGQGVKPAEQQRKQIHHAVLLTQAPKKLRIIPPATTDAI